MQRIETEKKKRHKIVRVKQKNVYNSQSKTKKRHKIATSVVSNEGEKRVRKKREKKIGVERALDSWLIKRYGGHKVIR